MSTTIHITTIDERMTLAIVATLLNQPGVTVSIDLDEMIDFVEPNHIVKRAPRMTKPITDARKVTATPRSEDEIRDMLWGPNSKAAKNIKSAERKAARERQLARETPEHLEWLAKMRHEERELKIAATQTTACPTCLATVFESCRTAGGGRYPYGNCHIGRVRAMQADQGDHATPVAK